MTIDRRAVLRSLTLAPLAAQVPGVDGVARLLAGDRGARTRTATPAVVGGDTSWLDDLPLLGRSGDWLLTRRLALPGPTSLVAVQAPQGARVAVRLGHLEGDLDAWHRLPLLGAEGEGPDGAEDERTDGTWRRMSRPLFAVGATALQVAVADARLEDVEVALLPHDDTASATTATRDADVRFASTVPRHGWRPPADQGEPDVLPTLGGLRIVRRAEWGADESWRGAPSYADRVRHAIVHHTVNGNAYSRADAPALVRSIYRYHTQALGWKDIGYNLLVDRYGVVYEGRYGGIDRPVIGAHAAGANAGSVGIGLIGDFRSASVPTAARNAILELLVALFELHGIDPRAAVTANGRRVSTLAGHGDVGSTTCPGSQVRTHFGTWREQLRRRVNIRFTDIAGHPHEQAIEQLRRAGVTSGYPDGTFRPDEPVDRGQMATFLTRAARLPPGQGTGFRDVPRRHPHHDGINAVATAGLAQGYPDGTFRPSREVTRAQMATFLARALGLGERLGLSFVDVLPHHPHYGTIEAVTQAGVANGYGDRRFRPERAVTRAQMAAFLVRAFLS